MRRLRIFLCFILFLTIKSATFAGEDVTSALLGRDFAPLLKPRRAFIGFIAPNYQRMKIEFVEVSRDRSNSSVYNVQGNSEVKGNKVPFTGKILIQKIEAVKNPMGGCYLNEKDLIEKTGQLIAKYTFSEDSRVRGSGIFSGSMHLIWAINKKGQIEVDTSSDCADGYANNQYKGIWTSYTTKKSKTANWGEFRVEDSGDLDIGAGEFSPNPKYFKNGWSNYNSGNNEENR